MNWEKIKKKYPLSYNELIDFFLRGWILCDKDINLRDLYDFFDSQGVWVDVTYETNGWELPPWFQGCVYSIPTILTKQYTSRRKAEKAVFKKAFEVLENKLKQN